MNNEEAKKQAIIDAWGEIAYELMNSIMEKEEPSYYRGFTEHGEVYGNFVPSNLKKLLHGHHMTNLNGWFKPKLLIGIEDNHGWIRIDENTIMPDSSIKVKVIAWGGKQDEAKYFKDNIWIHPEFPMRDIRNVTHFKLIKEEPNPTY